MTDSLRAAAQDVLDEFNNYSRVIESIEPLRTALAEPQECEWKRKGYGTWKSQCDVFHGDDGHPGDYMKFCYGCGKKIKFVESNDE